MLGLSSNIINTVIGSGIFVLPAIIAAGLGSASILAYVFCGVVIILMMLCYAEVGSKITEPGGVYVYIEKSFGKYPGFLTAIFMLLANIAGDAAIANAIVEIIFRLLPPLQSELIRILFMLILFSGFGYLNIRGLKHGIGFVKLITILKVAPLLLIVFIGFKDVNLTNLVWDSVPSIQQVGETSLILFFAFIGAESALSVSGEVRNPQKTIPRAILISIFIIGAIYVIVQTVAQGVLGPSLPSFKDNPLGEVASHIFGPLGFTLLTIGAAVSMFGAISSDILSSPRIFFAASADKLIPVKSLSRIHPKYATPHIAIIVYVSLDFLFAAIGEFQQLAIISSASILLISFGISLATIKLRKDKKFAANNKTFKIPGGFAVPVLSSLVILWLLSNLSKNEILSFVTVIIIFTIIYFLTRLIRKKRLEKSKG